MAGEEVSDSGAQKFNDSVAQKIGMRAMFFCSNPECSRFTTYKSVEDKTKKVGEAAHINAASDGGPRPLVLEGEPLPLDPKPSKEDLKKPENGIWLCRICHSKVDHSEGKYPTTLLKSWKKDHEDLIAQLVGLDIEAALVKLTQLRKSRHLYEAQKFLKWISSRRLLVYELHSESHIPVRYFMDDFRNRAAIIAAEIDEEAAPELYKFLEKCRSAAVKFFDAVRALDLEKLEMNAQSRDRKVFEMAITHFRDSLVDPIKELAASINYEMEWLPTPPKKAKKTSPS